MKKLSSLLLCLVLLLAACSPARPPDEDPGERPTRVVPTEEIALAVLSACGRDARDLERLDRELDGEALSAYLTGFYGLEEGSWEECAAFRAGGTEIFETAVLRLNGEEAAEAAAAALEDYITAREGDFTGYAPDQAAIAAQARAVRQGRYAALLLCADAEAAEDAFFACFDREPPEPDPEPDSEAGPGPAPNPDLAPKPDPEPDPDPEPGGPVSYPGRQDYIQPGIDDMTLYDTSAILDAWARDDDSGLSEKDRAIYGRCLQVLEESGATGALTGLDRERAVYRWLVSNVSYDYDHYNYLVETDPDSYGPYGPLLNGKGVCLGFATTFQLLMDLCGVECITVVGAAFQSRGDHAWNMVCLDGQWYCVDATWDSGSFRFWSYFNVSSEYMARTDHQWDYNSVPETGKVL